MERTRQFVTSKTFFIHFVLIVGSVAMVMPFLWMILTSLKTYAESIHVPPVIIPKDFQWGNYIEVFGLLPFFKFMFNTFIITVVRTAEADYFCVR